MHSLSVVCGLIRRHKVLMFWCRGCLRLGFQACVFPEISRAFFLVGLQHVDLSWGERRLGRCKQAG